MQHSHRSLDSTFLGAPIAFYTLKKVALPTPTGTALSLRSQNLMPTASIKVILLYDL